MGAISRHSYVTIKIKPDRYWLRRRNGFEQLRKKIVRDRKIVFGNVVLRYLHDNDAPIHRIRSCSPDEKFVICQKFSRLKQPEVARTSKHREHASAEHKAR